MRTAVRRAQLQQVAHAGKTGPNNPATAAVSMPVLNHGLQASDSSDSLQIFARAASAAASVARTIANLGADTSPTHKGSAGDDSPGRGTNSTSISDAEWMEVVRFHGVSSDVTNKFLHQARARFTESAQFQVVIGFLVCVNALMIGIDTDLVGYPDDDPLKLAMFVGEHIFCVIWCVEMFIYFYCEGLRAYFASGWNLMDFSLVVVAVTTNWLLPLIGGNGSSGGLLGSMTTLRMVRLLRLVRLMKLMRMFRELWLIVNGFLKAIRLLSFALLLLACVIYVSAIFMTMSVGHVCDTQFAEWSACHEYWGNVPSSMFSLFQVTTTDLWNMELIRPATQKQWWIPIFILLYFMMTTFGVVNVMVAVIVENTVEAAMAQRDAERQAAETRLFQELRGFKDIFIEADEDQSGVVDVVEFTEMMNNPMVTGMLKKSGIPIHDPLRLFEYLSDGGETLSISTFIAGVMQLQQPPSNYEMRNALSSVPAILGKWRRMEDAMSQVVGHLDPSMEFHLTRTTSRVASPHSTSSKHRLQRTVSSDNSVPGCAPSLPDVVEPRLPPGQHDCGDGAGKVGDCDGVPADTHLSSDTESTLADFARVQHSVAKCQRWLDQLERDMSSILGNMMVSDEAESPYPRELDAGGSHLHQMKASTALLHDHSLGRSTQDVVPALTLASAANAEMEESEDTDGVAFVPEAQVVDADPGGALVDLAYVQEVIAAQNHIVQQAESLLRQMQQMETILSADVDETATQPAATAAAGTAPAATSCLNVQSE